MSIVDKLNASGVNFTQKTSTNPVVKLKKQAKIFADVIINQINLLLLGPWGSGKTMFIVGLLEHGHKVFCISTDFGGTGLVTVRNELQRINKSHLEKNLVELQLETYDEVVSFFEKPESFFPDFYTFGFDVLFWDGFDNFQQSHVSDFVAAMVPERKSGVSEAREAGLQFEQIDWGQIKNATLSNLNRFFKLHNKRDGTIFHKVITCKAKVVQKKVGDKSEFVDVFQPNVSGAAGVLLGAAFSLILLTKCVKNREGKKFKYLTYADGENTCKNRGFNLPDEMDANPFELWKTVTEQLKIEKNKKDSELIEKD